MTTQTEIKPLSIPDAPPQPYPSAEEIIAAFRKHGIAPMRCSLFGWWVAPAMKPDSACALGALMFESVGERARSSLLYEALPHMAAGWKIGLTNGFDGFVPTPALRAAYADSGYDAGYATGQAVARWAGFDTGVR